MSFSVLEAKSELEAMLHGTTLGQVVNIDGVFNRAARQLMLDIDPQETKRLEPMSTPIYYQIFNYALPSDLKGQKVIDLIPTQNVLVRDVVYSTYNQNFDVYKNSNNVDNFTIISNKGSKYARIAYNNQSTTAVLNTCNSVNGNGIWSASGTASNLGENYQVTNGQSPTLSIDLTTGTGYVTNSTISPIDLTNHYNQASTFFTLYIPDTTKFTSTTIKIGSDSSNYYVSSALTTQFNGFALQNGYNQFGCLFSSMTTVGTPDLENISYVQIGITVNAAVYGLCFSQIQNSLGFLFQIEYYSKFLFCDTNGNWIEKVSDDSNLINLDTESYNIFLYLCQLFATQQALGQDASYDTMFADTGYQKAVMRYKKMYKSEIQKPQIPYYTRTFNGYNGMLGRGYNQQP